MRKINSPNELRACVEAYFREHDGSDKNPPTMSGFARHCGFRSRTAFLTYINDDTDGAEYNDIIQDAKLRIEEYNETQLTLARNSSGAQFALKNCGDGWAESLEVNGNFKHSVEEMLADVQEDELGSGM